MDIGVDLEFRLVSIHDEGLLGVVFDVMDLLDIGLLLLANARLMGFGAMLLGFGVRARVPGLAGLLPLAGARLLYLGVRLLGLGVRLLGLDWGQEVLGRLLAGVVILHIRG